MREASGRSAPHESQRLWRQQVQLSRGHWRREDAAGAFRSAGWWESVTITWAPAPAPGRPPPALLQRALAAAADVIAPVLADAAVASTRRLLERRQRGYPVASSVRRQLASARELPQSKRSS